jgi:hypothetical protein
MGTFDGLAGAGTAPVFDAGAITSEEASAIALIREQVGELPSTLVPECAHDFFFLRFLRGYQHNVKQATAAYREMLEYRTEHELNAVHDRLAAAGMPWPWDMDEFARLRETVGEHGYLHLHTQDLQGNILTHTLVEPTLKGMRAAIKAGLLEDYVRLFRYLDEWMLMRLHALCVERGHLVGEHMIVDVDGVGMFSFNGVVDLVKRFGKGSKHYPERIVHIDDVNNTSFAMFIWPIIKPWIPKHTAAKLRVAGRDYHQILLAQIAATELPVKMGGEST